MSELEGLWRLLESRPRLTGVRTDWESAAGACFGLLAPFLVSTGHCATRYPCEQQGEHCPRRVVHHDDAITAVCSDPDRLCETITLSKADIAVSEFDLLRLARHLATALGLSGTVAAVESLPDTVAAGEGAGADGACFPVYLTRQLTTEELDQVVERLIARSGTPFSLLLPRSRLLSPLASAALRKARCVPVALDTVTSAERGTLVVEPGARQQLALVGRVTVQETQLAAVVVARALVCTDGKEAAWRDLDEASYRALLASNARFEVFGDELSRSTRVRKKRHEQVPASRFRTVLAALERRVRYDPAVEGPHEEREDGKQTFQRARPLFDIKVSKNQWALFKTVPTDDGHAVYRFTPDEGCKFAFVFAALS